MHRVDPLRLDLAREFKSNPTGPHSPELQKLLKLLRWEPRLDALWSCSHVGMVPGIWRAPQGQKGTPWRFFTRMGT